MTRTHVTGILTAVALTCVAARAGAASITLTHLTGITGGTLAGTAVFRADLSSVGIGTIASITILDNSAGLGGANGQFTAFDLDAIKLSTTSCADAACAAALVGLPVFDFSTARTFFTPGTQRPPVDPKLFGTGAGGNTVDNAVATLGAFDGESSTVTPFGFLSMGDNGQLLFNLTSSVSTTGLFLYIGEVGDNGEAAAGSITVSDTPGSPVPEPATLILLGSGVLLRARAMLRRKP